MAKGKKLTVKVRTYRCKDCGKEFEPVVKSDSLAKFDHFDPQEWNFCRNCGGGLKIAGCRYKKIPR